MALGTGGWVGGAVNQARNVANRSQPLTPEGASQGAAAGFGGAFTQTTPDPMSNTPPQQGPTTIQSGPTPVALAPPTPTQFGGGVGGMAGAGVGAQQAWNYAETLHGPTQSALDMQAHLATQGGALGQQANALAAQALQSGYGNSAARLNLQGNDLGLNRASNDVARGLLGVDREGVGVGRKYTQQMHGIDSRDLASRIAGLEQGLATDQANTTEDYGSRGAYFAPFHRRDLADNYATALRGMEDAARRREGQQYGTDRDLANYGLDDKRIDLKYQDLALNEKRLDNEAARIGISRRELDDSLQQGLAKLGLQGKVDAHDLATALNSNDIEQAQLAYQIMVDAAMYSGNPAVMQILGSVYANMGG